MALLPRSCAAVLVCTVMRSGVLLAGLGGLASAQSYGVLERVSLANDEQDPHGNSGLPAISANGRFVTFVSDSPNIVPNDTNVKLDIFVRDRVAMQNFLVSVSSSGQQGNGNSNFPSISATGRFVAFESLATNLVANDTNAARDIFVFDRDTATIERVSIGINGEESNGHSQRPHISSDGRYVVFTSSATNLVVGDTNGVVDVFRYDRQQGSTIRISVPNAGGEANGPSSSPTISADGRFITFQSSATNLVVNDTNGVDDIFVRDSLNAATYRVSVAPGGLQLDAASTSPRMTSDARYIAFSTSATQLVGPNPLGALNVFVLDQVFGSVERVSIGVGQANPDSHCYMSDISMNGRFVTFSSFATNLVEGDTNHREDVFVYDRDFSKTWRVSVSNEGQQGNGFSNCPVISADGTVVAFASDSNHLVPDDGNDSVDVFTFDFTLGNPPPPLPFVTIELLPLNGRIAATKVLGKGTFRVTGLYTITSNSIDGAISPNTDGMHVEIGDAKNPLVFDVEPNDPRWKVTKSGVYRWRSPKESSSIHTIVVDTKKGRFTITGSKQAVTPPTTTEVTVRLQIGNDLALDTRQWLPSKVPGTLTYTAKPPKKGQ